MVSGVLTMSTVPELRWISLPVASGKAGASGIERTEMCEMGDMVE